MAREEVALLYVCRASPLLTNLTCHRATALPKYLWLSPVHQRIGLTDYNLVSTIKSSLIEVLKDQICIDSSGISDMAHSFVFITGECYSLFLSIIKTKLMWVY